MDFCIDFSEQQTRLVLEGLITQTVLPYNENTKDIKIGDVFNISFAGISFKNYLVRITNVTITDLGKLTSKDIFENGFMYKPFFLKFMQDKSIHETDTILKISFELKEELNNV